MLIIGKLPARDVESPLNAASTGRNQGYTVAGDCQIPVREPALRDWPNVDRLGATDILPQGYKGFMQARRFGILGVVATLLCGLSAGVGAQDQTTGGNVELGVETKANVSAEEQLGQADAITRRGSALAARLTKMLGEARRDKDIMRANCINRKLMETNANVRNVDQRVRALKEAAQVGDEGRRNHEFTVLSVLAQKFDVLEQEAAQCLGQSVFEPGASQVVTTVPTNIYTAGDPSTVPSTPPPPPAVNVPPTTSDNT